jgi:hypothetical protein
VVIQAFIVLPRSSKVAFGKHVVDKAENPPQSEIHAQVAELVDALVSGTSGESRGGSSPLLGTTANKYH